jgi:Holliday junction resolvase RusA-like endonuclease
MKFFASGIPLSKGNHVAFCPKLCPGNVREGISKRPFVTEDTRSDRGRKVAEWEQTIRVASRAVAPPVPISGPVKVTYNFYIPQPKCHAKECRPLFSRNDADKLWRAVGDALQAQCGGYLLEDDKQIVRWGEGGIWWADERGPGVLVEVTPLGPEQETLFGNRV